MLFGRNNVTKCKSINSARLHGSNILKNHTFRVLDQCLRINVRSINVLGFQANGFRASGTVVVLSHTQPIQRNVIYQSEFATANESELSWQRLFGLLAEVKKPFFIIRNLGPLFFSKLF